MSLFSHTSAYTSVESARFLVARASAENNVLQVLSFDTILPIVSIIFHSRVNLNLGFRIRKRLMIYNNSSSFSFRSRNKMYRSELRQWRSNLQLIAILEQ